MTDDAAGPCREPGESTGADAESAGPTSAGGLAAAPAAPQRRALIAGLTGAAVSAGLVVWLAFGAGPARHFDARHDVFVQAARRTAVDLTTIDYQHARADVQRVLDSATGDFHRNFSRRSEMLIEAVTREHSQSVSAVTEAGVESQSGDVARVLVALSVASTHLGGLDLQPHELRMRLTVQRQGDDAKVSDVEYVT